MSQKIFTIKVLNIVVVSICAVAFVYCAYIYTQGSLLKDLPQKENLTFALILYDEAKSASKNFDAFIIYYEKKTECLKILSLNTDAVVIRQRGKTASFKENFNTQLKKSKKSAIENFFSNLDEVFDETIKPDYYVCLSYADFWHFLSKKQPVLSPQQAETNKISRDFENLGQLKTAREFLNFLKRNSFLSSIKIIDNYSALSTNISRLSFISLISRFKLKNPRIVFYDMPVRRSFRLEPNKQDIKYFLKNIYFAELQLEKVNKGDGFIEIQNASQKMRTAYNAAMFLRQQGYDVLDWGNSANPYEETLIKEYKGDFAYALSLADIFKTKNIIISYQGQNYYKASVYIGKQGFEN